ncbi:MAG: S8 family peptidase [Bacteroidetes bacterium]|nr:S8 family peptidase [Bacteroidota bacterium]
MIYRRNFVNISGICKNFAISFLLLIATTWSYSQDYVRGKIIFKLIEEDSVLKNEEKQGIIVVQEYLKQIDYKIDRKFPSHNSPSYKYNSNGQKLVDLSLIHELIVDENEDLDYIIQLLYQSGVVEYAEKYYIPELFSYTPNDPLAPSQYYLNNIQAYLAWGITRGDTNQIIAIIDTGTDLTHPDLINSIKYNYNDPINGYDSDNDGYIDNFQGWDLGEGDNNPQYNANSHGVLVCGYAGATADNNTGIAGVGFNSKILPVKIDNESGRLTMAYEGIVYAADRGATVMNLSWGGVLGAGQFGQDIINYAAINRDIVVIAAAGNSNNQIPIYPAAYNNTISVAATDINDVKWSGSSYGITIDISAPGTGGLTTWPNSSYNPGSGTSFAAPIVAGAAALLRSHFPNYNAKQIAAQLKVTADNIYDISENNSFQGLLGTGRLNIFRALTETDNPYIELIALEHTEEFYSKIQPGETVNLSAFFRNILSTVDNVTAILQTNSQYIDIITQEINLGTAPNNEIINNLENPFVIKLLNNYPPSNKADFIITFYNNGEYAGRETFSIVFNIDYINIFPNTISTTVTSKGTIGYNYPNFNQGLGLKYSLYNRSLIKCAGLIIGNSTSKVVDNIYGATEGTFNQFFKSITNAEFINDPENSHLEIRGSFNDDNAGAFKMNLKIDYTIKAWDEAPDNKYLILEYDIINNSGEQYSSLYTGFFADWIIQDNKSHRASFDIDNNLGYAYSTSGGYYTGISLLSDYAPKHYAFDNQGYGGSLKISDGFTSFEKYTALKSNRNSAGLFDTNNDISTLLGSGPFILNHNDTLKIAFALLVGDHLTDLKQSAISAKAKYTGNTDDDDDDDDDDDNYVSETNSQNPYKIIINRNPFASNIFSFDFLVYNQITLGITITDIHGSLVYKSNPELLNIGNYSFNVDASKWSQGTYLMQLYTGENVQTIKIIKL